MQPGGEAPGDLAALQQWFTRRGRACLRRWRWLAVLAIVSTLLAVVGLSGRNLLLHWAWVSIYFGGHYNPPPHVGWWLSAVAPRLWEVCAVCAAIGGVALASLISLAQIPPAEVQLPFAKEQLARGVRARLRANSWFWIGCTLLTIQVATLLWDVDTIILLRREAAFYSWWRASPDVVSLFLGLLLLHVQGYVVAVICRTRVSAMLSALPLLCFLGLTYKGVVVGSGLYHAYYDIAGIFAVPVIWAMVPGTGLIALAVLVACWLLDRMTLVECRRLVEEAR